MSKKVNDGGPAFPQIRGGDVSWDDGTKSREIWDHPGMSIRDYFAAQALAGICSSGPSAHWTNDRISKDAYELADAMIARREETE